MTSPIDNFQDILDAMERDPALRDALRRYILTEELLQMPVRLERVEADIKTLKGDVSVLKEDVAVLKEDVSVLKEDVAVLKEDVSVLKEDVAVLKEDVSVLKEDVSVLKEDVSVLKEDVSVLKEDVSVLKEDVSVLKEDVSVLKEDVSVLKEDVSRMGGDVSRLLGADYESHVATYAHRFLRRSLGINAMVFTCQRDRSALTSLMDEAEAQGLIEARETDELDRADLILTADGPTSYILAEVSLTVQQDDIDRAVERAALLAKATTQSVTPLAIGAREQIGIRRGDVVVMLIPGPRLPDLPGAL